MEKTSSFVCSSWWRHTPKAFSSSPGYGQANRPRRSPRFSCIECDICVEWHQHPTIVATLKILLEGHVDLKKVIGSIFSFVEAGVLPFAVSQKPPSFPLPFLAMVILCFSVIILHFQRKVWSCYEGWLAWIKWLGIFTRSHCDLWPIKQSTQQPDDQG